MEGDGNISRRINLELASVLHHKEHLERQLVKAREQLEAAKKALRDCDWKIEWLRSLTGESLPPPVIDESLSETKRAIRERIERVRDAIERNGPGGPGAITDFINQDAGSEVMTAVQTTDVLRKNPEIFENPERGIWRLKEQPF